MPQNTIVYRLHLLTEVFDVTSLALNFSEQFILYMANMQWAEEILAGGVYDTQKFVEFRDKVRGIEPDGYLAMTMDEVITFYVALDFSCKFFVSGAGDAYREHFITTQLGNEEDFEEVRTSYLQQATFIMKDLEANYAIVHERFKRSMEKLATYEVE